MRTSFLSALVLLFVAQPVRADLVFTTPAAEVGKVRAGLPLEHRFAFVNKGTAPVHVVEARASCGCLAPRIERRDYAPGAAGVLLLTINTLGQPAGPHRWHVHVTYRHGAKLEQATLELKAQLISEVSVSPAALTLNAGQELAHDLTLTDLRDKPMRVRQVRTSSPFLQAKLSRAYRNEAGRHAWKIGLTLKEEYPAGRREEVVSIHSDDPVYGELRVPVTVVKRGADEVTVLPREVRLTAAGDRPVPSRIVILRGDDRQVVIDKASADHPAVVCQWAQGPGKHATLKVNIDRRRIEGKSLQATVKIIVSAPAGQTLELPVRCTLE